MQPPISHSNAAASCDFVLRLYVAGQTPKCMRAFSNLKKICEQYLANRYRIEMIDLLDDPALARGDQILAVPTLVCGPGDISVAHKPDEYVALAQLDACDAFLARLIGGLQ